MAANVPLYALLNSADHLPSATSASPAAATPPPLSPHSSRELDGRRYQPSLWPCGEPLEEQRKAVRIAPKGAPRTKTGKNHNAPTTALEKHRVAHEASKRAVNKAAERARRDQLRDALDRLDAMVTQATNLHLVRDRVPSPPKDTASGDGSRVYLNTKVSTVERAIYCIEVLQSQLRDTNGNLEGKEE